jgi:hypothetical protein
MGGRRDTSAVLATMGWPHAMERHAIPITAAFMRIKWALLLAFIVWGALLWTGNYPDCRAVRSIM